MTPWTATWQASLSFTNSQSLLKLMYIESVMLSNHLILYCPLLLQPSILPSIRVSSWVSSLYQVGKVLDFQLQHQSFQWTPRTDLFKNRLVGSPCSSRNSQESSPTPQLKSITSSVSTLFMVQLSHPYMTTGKTITLTRRTFVGKVMSLLFNNFTPI